MAVTKSKLDYFILALGLAPSIASTIWVLFETPDFKRIFTGMEIPLPTELFINLYFLTPIAPILVFVMWKYWPFHKLRYSCTLVTGITLGLAMTILFIWAMYLPIMELGKPLTPHSSGTPNGAS